ncbi:MAG: DNA polymerase III subunit psi [Sphingobacteriaceae bacterium]|nr:DNA polymerase III subunit psi [Sphingobacteriaceae bacterium]
MFVANFIDDVSFVLAGESPQPLEEVSKTIDKRPETIGNPEAATPKFEAKPEEKPIVKVEAPAPMPSVPVEEVQKPTLPAHKDRVVVLSPQKPSDSEISFLNKILAAVAVDPTSVVHIHQSFAARELTAFASAKIILSFGAVTDFVPDHQVRSKAITVIIAKSLGELEQDVASKKKLWESMKGFFK